MSVLNAFSVIIIVLSSMKFPARGLLATFTLFIIIINGFLYALLTSVMSIDDIIIKNLQNPVFCFQCRLTAVLSISFAQICCFCLKQFISTVDMFEDAVGIIYGETGSKIEDEQICRARKQIRRYMAIPMCLAQRRLLSLCHCKSHCKALDARYGSLAGNCNPFKMLQNFKEFLLKQKQFTIYLLKRCQRFGMRRGQLPHTYVTYISKKCFWIGG